MTDFILHLENPAIITIKDTPITPYIAKLKTP
jgi:hypothetical protein